MSAIQMPIAILAVWILSVSRVAANGAGSRDANTPPPPLPPTVQAIHAYGFNAATGVVGKEDLLVATDRWNDTTGTLFVVVEIAGPESQGYARRGQAAYSMRFAATDRSSSKQLFGAARPIVSLSEQGSLFFAFIVEFAPCTSVNLSARIVGRQGGVPLEGTAFFPCGE